MCEIFDRKQCNRVLCQCDRRLICGNFYCVSQSYTIVNYTKLNVLDAIISSEGKLAFMYHSDTNRVRL